MRSKLFETRGAVFGVVLDTAHVLVVLMVISTTSDVTTGVTTRKTMTEITRRVLVDLLISIATTIEVVVMKTSTTFLSALVTATAIATTTWGIGCSLIVTMLATWML
jgi:phage-related holin